MLNQNDDDLVELHAIFRGGVQGVGFRYTAQNYATRLGLKGTVRNLHDGTVELYAVGTRQLLDELLRSLQKSFNPIDSVDTFYSPPTREFEGFQIIK